VVARGKEAGAKAAAVTAVAETALVATWEAAVREEAS
jgi:hypothetical protein